ncbi:MAG: hypothetical protein ACREOY_08625 [Candidatus Dormibacteraceae bacterium]
MQQLAHGAALAVGAHRTQFEHAVGCRRNQFCIPNGYVAGARRNARVLRSHVPAADGHLAAFGFAR